MKKIRLIKFSLVVILTLAVSSSADAGIDDKPTGAAKGIKKTRHNLSNWGLYDVKATTETQVCIFCHTPHNADSSVVPLWGHKDTAETNFQMASSFYVTPTGGDEGDDQPTGISKKCLSCHDGTVAVGAVAGGNITMTGVDGNGYLLPGARGNIGTNLASGHVISFKYSNLFPNNTSLTKLKSWASIDVADRKSMFDRDGKMQCHSCHDPHTDWCDDPNKTVGNDPLWRKKCDTAPLQTGKTDSNATVCVVCHKIAFSGYSQEILHFP